MGRFDLLTKVDEEKPEKRGPSQTSTTPPPVKQDEGKANDRTTERSLGTKPDSMKSGIHENQSQPVSLVEKPQKYSTLLNPGLIKKIKVYAVERELKDYEVIEKALTDLFEKDK